MLASLSVSGLSNGTPTLLFLCRASRTLACVKATVHTIFVASKVPSLLPDKSAALPALLLGACCLLIVTALLQLPVFLGAVQLTMVSVLASWLALEQLGQCSGTLES